MIKRIFSTPMSIVTAPLDYFSGIWNDAGRGSHLIMGLPAIIFGILGVSAICYSVFGDVGSLEKRYDGLAQEAHDKSQKLFDELMRELRVIASQTGERVDIHTQIPDTNERKIELYKSQDAERIYLEKLIELNEGNLDYKYRLAQLSLMQNQQEKGLSLMNTIAPQTEPGYSKAHLYMARLLLSQPVKSKQESLRNQAAALDHLLNCLVRDKNNAEALQMKAQLLVGSGRLVEAYEIYDQLFENDPLFYIQMIRINQQQKQPERNSGILDQAILKFRKNIRDQADDVSAWVSSWQHYVNCLIQKQDHVTAEASITEEIKKQETELANRKFLEKLLAAVYTNWAAATGGRAGDAQEQAQQLDYLQKSMKYDDGSVDTLRWLAFLGNSPVTAVSEKARKIYDARNDQNAPGAVSSELGAYALATKNFEEAIKHFENARKKAPRDPRVLNNLAYAYLKAEDRNPERALLLIDQALTFVSSMAEQARRVYQSHFFHTRGEALLQLDRLTEAAAAFEIAIQDRPDNEDILEKLIKCYEGRDEKLQEVYKRRLESVRAKKRANTDAGN